MAGRGQPRNLVVDHRSAEFHDFFDRHHAELARFAWLLTGEADAANDLAADALVALWQRWDRLRAAEQPLAYARGVVANLARERIRSAVRERRRIALFFSRGPQQTHGPDLAAVVDVDEVGPSLRYATAKVNKASRNGGAASAPSDAPWGSAPASGAAGDEPPF